MAFGVTRVSIDITKRCALDFGFSPFCSCARQRLAKRGQNVLSFRRHGDRLHTEVAASTVASTPPAISRPLALPELCPGCGAYAQSVHPQEPGFYSSHRKSVKDFLAGIGNVAKVVWEDARLIEQNLVVAGNGVRSQLGVGPEVEGRQAIQVSVPICNRCHDLLHHARGVSVAHPSIPSLQQIISESPHKYNHIYHVLDAADFPLSLIPNLQRRLALSPQRSQNRRAKTTSFQHGQSMDMSFIITRADLLAPRKEQVDSLMPYLVQVLRDALGHMAENARLGNIRCVSAKRGWWTSRVKEEIWGRGGGGWLVGKVNVGKSNFFENVFPKGRTDGSSLALSRHVHDVMDLGMLPGQLSPSATGSEFDREVEDCLLPPAAPEIPFPVLPLVSSLPGTTASPIRLSFGNGKGELVDLPGLNREDLEGYVVAEHRHTLFMEQRPKPDQLSIKPGQSLLVGGLVRITPLTDNLTVLAYPFVPLKSHVATTERIAAIQKNQEPHSNLSIARNDTGNRIASAGKYSMKWDVTKQRAGPLTRKDAAGLHTKILPFIVFSMDVLIEGCGWVELVAQMRKKDFDHTKTAIKAFDDSPYPLIEVFSPLGKYIGVRRPMNAWLLNGQKPGSSKPTTRPRRSVKGEKKRHKSELNERWNSRT